MASVEIIIDLNAQMTIEVDGVVGSSCGNITDAIAERLGCNPTRYCWKCAEWEPTEAWKNIFRALDAFVDAIVLDNEEAVEQCDQ